MIPRWLFLLPALGLVPFAHAATVTLQWQDAGWYRQDGLHQAGNNNYSTGWVGSIPIGNSTVDKESRSFFVFDLTGYAGSITGAQLRVFVPACDPFCGFQSPSGVETFALFDVATPPATLSADATNAVGVFADLGSGTQYGSRDFTSADNGAFVLLAIDANGIAAMNASSGLFAIGGAITTLARTHNVNEIVFGYSYAGADDPQLILTNQRQRAGAGERLAGGAGVRRGVLAAAAQSPVS